MSSPGIEHISTIPADEIKEVTPFEVRHEGVNAEYTFENGKGVIRMGETASFYENISRIEVLQGHHYIEVRGLPDNLAEVLEEIEKQLQQYRLKHPTEATINVPYMLLHRRQPLDDDVDVNRYPPGHIYLLISFYEQVEGKIEQELLDSLIQRKEISRLSKRLQLPELQTAHKGLLNKVATAVESILAANSVEEIDAASKKAYFDHEHTHHLQQVRLGFSEVVSEAVKMINSWVRITKDIEPKRQFAKDILSFICMIEAQVYAVELSQVKPSKEDKSMGVMVTEAMRCLTAFAKIHLSDGSVSKRNSLGKFLEHRFAEGIPSLHGQEYVLPLLILALETPQSLRGGSIVLQKIKNGLSMDSIDQFTAELEELAIPAWEKVLDDPSLLINKLRDPQFVIELNELLVRELVEFKKKNGLDKDRETRRREALATATKEFMRGASKI